MSSERAIRVDGLSKAYMVYAEPRDRLRQAVMPRLNRLMRRIGFARQDNEYFTIHYALHDLSFEVQRGETLAIIGRNGSGKSTLLQLVCGTLTPTAGQVQVVGRVAALLELGSGFNPEYTGRENVLLNASVLGLSRAETLARMENILAFAEIGDFVDQPVKTYSSGMAMRLAFAVIAHVDADVLIIDEALAVGDAMFQQKCFRWLREFQSRGTVLYCGHDTNAVANLCQRAIWLDRGHLRMTGPAGNVAEAYSLFAGMEAMGIADARPASAVPDASPPSLLDPMLRPMAGRESIGLGGATITHVGLTLANGEAPAWFAGGEEVALTLRIDAREAIADGIVGFILKDRLGQFVAGTNTLHPPHARHLAFASGASLLRIPFRMPLLHPGEYALTASIAVGIEAHVQLHWIHEAMVVRIERSYSSGLLVSLPCDGVTLQRG